MLNDAANAAGPIVGASRLAVNGTATTTDDLKLSRRRHKVNRFQHVSAHFKKNRSCPPLLLRALDDQQWPWTSTPWVGSRQHREPPLRRRLGPTKILYGFATQPGTASKERRQPSNLAIRNQQVLEPYKLPRLEVGSVVLSSQF